ncbi:hypothetical protein MMC25_002924 [Agyrium rufum]|nr:hypothetical protein [Agyrium rufum]
MRPLSRSVRWCTSSSRSPNLLRRRPLSIPSASKRTTTRSKTHHPSTPPSSPTAPPSSSSPTRTFINRNSRPLLLFFSTLTWLPLYYFIHNKVIQPMWVSGRSMHPFLNTDIDSSSRRDVVLVNMWDPYSNVRRGSIVAFWAPHDPEKMVVKRVVALEGDEVRTRREGGTGYGGVVGMREGGQRVLVPQGCVWVEGEDRGSRDSNDYGPIATALIVGHVMALVWPWSRAAWVRPEDYRGSLRIREGVQNFDKVVLS